ncbi:MAG: AmmeMemoRadiSam system protein B [Spirochaetaceae bacterium]|nr:AmmeMemoRadiSam system protein B [Spirochaetaceae bacterium]
MNQPDSAKKKIKPSKKDRQAVMQGLFYPADNALLENELDGLFKKAEQPPSPMPVIISPHGSLAYSGQLAAGAWKAASTRKCDTIVLIGPSHRNFEPGIFLSESSTFSMPAHVFKVDRKATRNLARSNSAFLENDIPHLEEHGIEMQLLFAGRIFPEAVIIPVLVSSCDSSLLDELFSNLYFILQNRLDSLLIVLTSNMAVDRNAATCLRKTVAFVQDLINDDIGAVEAAADPTSFCGARLIAAYMRSQFNHGKHASSLGIDTSAKFMAAGDPVVGYAAIGFGDLP